MPAEFTVCGNCGTLLESDEASVEAVNSKPSDAIRMLVGPGFSSPQPHTDDSRPGAMRRLKPGVKKIIKKRNGSSQARRDPAGRPRQDGAPGWGAPRGAIDSPSPLTGQTRRREEATGARNVGEHKTCGSCGAQMGPENQFCGRCGNRLPPARPAEPTCPSCGTKGTAGQRFCGNCGGTL